MKTLRTILFVVLSLALISSLYAQLGQTGSIRGKVSDDQKVPLPGVTITVTSPALMGKQSTVSARDGTFKFPPILHPGTYTVVAELEGFNTVKREGVIVRVGMNVDLTIEMAPAKITEEIKVVAPSPIVDITSSKVNQNVTAEIIKTLPVSDREVWTLVSTTAAGVLGRAQIHGESRQAYMLKADGIPANSSEYNTPETRVDMDTIEEVEFITGAVDSDQYGTRSGYLNVITKSGGNDFHGSAQLYYTGKKSQQILPSDEQLSALGLSKPVFYKYYYDTSGTLGGRIIRDKLWFFTSFKYVSNRQAAGFSPTTIAGTKYESYDQIETKPFCFGKLTFQPSKAIKFFSIFSYVKDTQKYYRSYWYWTASANFNNIPTQYTSSNGLTWILNPNTFLDVRAGFYTQPWRGTYTPEAVPGPHFIDSYTRYEWGNRGRDGALEYTWEQNRIVAVNLVRYQDDFLGGDHELRVGAEWAGIHGEWGYWRENPIDWYYYNGNPYYYRGLYGLTDPHPLYGDGRLDFAIYGVKRGDSQRVGYGNRIGVYVQDSMKIWDRLTISLGLRYDKMWTYLTPQVKKSAGGIAPAIGEYYFDPAFGINPFKELSFEGWKNPYPFRGLAPTIGVTYDLFGNGKTALKLHYGTYFDPVSTGIWTDLVPYTNVSYTLYWWDLNLNGQPDEPPIDKYEIPAGTNPLTLLSTEFKKQIDPHLKNPYTREIIAQIESELLPNFKLGLAYIYRDRKNITASLNYDSATGTYWNLLEQHPEWWVPFTTTVPGYLNFPAREVTVYYRTLTAPLNFGVLTNVPQQKYHYHGIELTFDKRMSKGWSLGGNISYSYQWSTGSFLNPNNRVNAEARQGRPWWGKLYGTFNAPLGFVMSFIYTHIEGTYWGRTVSISAPTAWINANQVVKGSISVNVEPPDTDRNPATDNCDFRIEKVFQISNVGRVGLFVDVLNLFGSIYPDIIQNPGGTWKPVDNNSSQGTYTPGQIRVTALNGVRSFRFSIRFDF
jgi:hypothetical protein